MKFTPFPLIEVRGSAFERGRQHGELARERVHRSVAHYLVQLEGMGIRAELMRDLVRRYLPLAEAFDPNYVEEMRGIAAGAQTEFERIVLVNARTEILQLARIENERGLTLHEDDPDGCTGVSLLPQATADRSLLHALNWDWKVECAETAMVLCIRREDGPDVLTLTEAGSLARAGMNACGLTVTANYLESSRDYTSLGVPHALIRRKILESAHLALAIRTICCTAKSSSNNLLLGHVDGFSIDFECAPDEVFALYPRDGLIVHANHWTSPAALAKLKDTGVLLSPESYYRDWRVREALLRNIGHLTPAHLRESLSDDFGSPWSVCRPPRPSLFGNLSATVAMILMQPAAGTMEVTPVPAINRDRTRYTLEMQSSVTVPDATLASTSTGR